jgi:elongation factor G
MNYAAQFNLPRFVVVNKMNRDNANFRKALDSVQLLSDVRLLPLQLPWGERGDFKGVIDLLSMQAFEGDGKTAQPIPAELVDDAETARMELIEAAAEGEDSLLEKYLEGEELSAEEIQRGLMKVVHNCGFAPVFVTAGSAQIGLGPLLDGMIALLPSPADVGAVVPPCSAMVRLSSRYWTTARWQCTYGRPRQTPSSGRSPTSGCIRAR